MQVRLGVNVCFVRQCQTCLAVWVVSHRDKTIPWKASHKNKLLKLREDCWPLPTRYQANSAKKGNHLNKLLTTYLYIIYMEHMFCIIYSVLYIIHVRMHYIVSWALVSLAQSISNQYSTIYWKINHLNQPLH